MSLWVWRLAGVGAFVFLYASSSLCCCWRSDAKAPVRSQGSSPTASSSAAACSATQHDDTGLPRVHETGLTDSSSPLPGSLGCATARTHAQRLASRDGYFAPESVIRRVGNSPLTPFLGGGPAVLLQVAHPLVAAGVFQHSDFRRDLWRRLARTLRALYLITYGTKEEAERAGAAVRAVHAHVRGVTTERLGCFPAGTPYSAQDPQLQLWVHATLVAASLAAYQRFVRRLSRPEQDTYYREMALVAELFGVPRAVIPDTLADFRNCFVAQVESERITVT